MLKPLLLHDFKTLHVLHPRLRLYLYLIFLRELLFILQNLIQISQPGKASLTDSPSAPPAPTPPSTLSLQGHIKGFLWGHTMPCTTSITARVTPHCRVPPTTVMAPLSFPADSSGKPSIMGRGGMEHDAGSRDCPTRRRPPAPPTGTGLGAQASQTCLVFSQEASTAEGAAGAGTGR